jgi:hypothetical protein
MLAKATISFVCFLFRPYLPTSVVPSRNETSPLYHLILRGQVALQYALFSSGTTNETKEGSILCSFYCGCPGTGGQ